MARLTKKLQRTMSTEEHLRHYFDQLHRELNTAQWKRWRVVRVERLLADGNTEVLQLRQVLQTTEGVIVVVR